MKKLKTIFCIILALPFAILSVALDLLENLIQFVNEVVTNIGMRILRDCEQINAK